MQVIMIAQPGQLFLALHEIIRMAFPACNLQRETTVPADIIIEMACMEDPAAGEVLFEGVIAGHTRIASGYKRQTLGGTPGPGMQNEIKRRARIFLYNLLCSFLNRKISGYGILTGVRPVKLVHRYLDRGMSGGTIQHRLQEEYLISPGKMELLLEVAENQRPFVRSHAAGTINLYIGIPYCSSRCSYCSFPGAVLRDYAREMKPYLEALWRELKLLADYLSGRGIPVQNIYIGGGTPSLLERQDLERLFVCLRCFPGMYRPQEITFEAGRPDSLSREKIKQLKTLGVTRVCINPQSMHDRTLRDIGRRHGSLDVIQALGWARREGIECVNMDMIIGLPGETTAEHVHTIKTMIKYEPENITLHILAVKRGSDMVSRQGRAITITERDRLEQSMRLVDELIRAAGYAPYYLYRQKFMLADVENIGYARPGKACLYNMQMMEESHSVIGAGGGAGSKLVNRHDGSISAHYNPKNPEYYIAAVDRLISDKIRKIEHAGIRCIEG